MADFRSPVLSDSRGISIINARSASGDIRPKKFAVQGCVEWSDPGLHESDLPDSGEWKRSNIPPLENTTRIVRVTNPFSATFSQPFEVLFMPTLSFFNGLVEHPSEVLLSVFAHCQMWKVLRAGDSDAWIEIDVSTCIHIDQIDRRTPPRPERSEDFRDFLGFVGEPIYNIAQHQNFTIFEWNIQGNCGLTLVTKKSNGSTHLLCASEWSQGHDEAHRCNIALSDSSAAVLESLEFD